MLGTMFDALKATEDMTGNYDSRKVNRTERNGLILSTAYTTDMGYETAILDKNGVHPVERYKDVTLAIKGHIKWDKKLDSLKEITKLGYGFVDEYKLTLKRYDEAKKVKKPLKRRKST